MAKFLDRHGSWVAWSYGDGGGESAEFISEDPLAAVIYYSNHNWCTIAFWPERMSISEAIKWWDLNNNKYEPEDREAQLKRARESLSLLLGDGSSIGRIAYVDQSNSEDI